MTREVEQARARSAVLCRLVLANGGWKYRAGVPMSDEDVRRAAEPAVLELGLAYQRLAVAEQLIEELGRESYYTQLLKGAGLLRRGEEKRSGGVTGERDEGAHANV